MITLTLLTGCAGGGNRAPVDERVTAASKARGFHIVAKGETLYTIAWRYGVDYKTLARRNGISSRSYTIYPGQKIYLYRSVAKASSSVSRSPTKSQVTPSKPQSTVATRSKTPTKSATTVKGGTSSNDPSRWYWPTQGRIIGKFSSQKSLNKGVDLDGRLGESVKAAAGGTVVYAGSGIRGYGNLVIIKHSERFLSAYAHNSRLLVKEKQIVKAGQKIAEIGNSGTDRYKLHFEIRRDGQPVDPLRYLPRR